jgi:HK97 gp10 family phage protein
MKTISLKSKAMKLEGVPQMVKTVRDIGAALSGESSSAFNDRLKDVVMKPAMVVRDEARDLVPVVTGTLKDAIFAGPLKDKPGALVGVKGVYYAAFVEFGTSRSEARPYFRPALNATRPLYANMIAGDLQKLIEDVARTDAWHAGDSGGGS